MIARAFADACPSRYRLRRSGGRLRRRRLVGRRHRRLASLNVELNDDERALVAALSKRERQVNPDFAPVWDASDR